MTWIDVKKPFPRTIRALVHDSNSVLAADELHPRNRTRLDFAIRETWTDAAFCYRDQHVPLILDLV
jgi:hypothetical protein